VGERRFSLVFAPFQKVTRRARDWLRKTAMDGLLTRQARTIKNKKPSQQPTGQATKITGQQL